MKTDPIDRLKQKTKYIRGNKCINSDAFIAIIKDLIYNHRNIDFKDITSENFYVNDDKDSTGLECVVNNLKYSQSELNGKSLLVIDEKGISYHLLTDLVYGNRILEMLLMCEKERLNDFMSSLSENIEKIRNTNKEYIKFFGPHGSLDCIVPMNIESKTVSLKFLYTIFSILINHYNELNYQFIVEYLGEGYINIVDNSGMRNQLVISVDLNHEIIKVFNGGNMTLCEEALKHTKTYKGSVDYRNVFSYLDESIKSIEAIKNSNTVLELDIDSDNDRNFNYLLIKSTSPVKSLVSCTALI